ncbi:MAG: isoprenyl transferase [Halanaerobiaceae bacterium]
MDIPEHVAIIMDGNGRWAKKQGLPRREGHKEGVKALKRIVEESVRLNIDCLTVYAFSTENWKRPRIEVNFLMKLFRRTLHQQAQDLNENNVCVKIIGRREKLPDYLVKEIDYIEQLTADNSGLLLNIAFNYGGRTEIVDAVRSIFAEGIENISEINPERIAENLSIPEYEDMELLIRTGGEKRLSNFMLWQSAYAELYFTDKYWPDFEEKDLRLALEEFTERERRFGSIDEGEEK